jgi:hypothetical protein
MTAERRELFDPSRAAPREYGKNSSSPCPIPFVFPLPAHGCMASESLTDWCTRKHEAQDILKTNFHYRFPGFFRLLQSSIDAYVDGRIIVRDSREVLFCKMSGGGGVARC